ncbi:hypothetical protein SDC9_01501 [bioreactor metagenome]|uniref:Uncharacterized protein n=1 Tax=bioreactor metagenome TaxID=1076179 RepID=A0A644SMY5_9ZZZZ
MSRNYAIVDGVNKTVQFTIDDACSSISYSAKKAGQSVSLSKSEISVDLVRKGKTDVNLYKDTANNIVKIVKAIFNKQISNLIPLSFRNEFGHDLNLSDSVSVKITIKFYKDDDEDETVDSFEYEMNKLGKSKGSSVNKLPFTFKKIEVDTVKEIDTEYLKHLIVLDSENLISLASDTPKDGDVYLTKEYLDSEFSELIHLETALNQTVEVKSNGITNVYLAQY